MALVVVNSRKGQQSIETSLTLQQAATILSNKAGRSPFENDLIAAHKQWKDRLTSGRAAWLLFLAQSHLDRTTCGHRPQPTTDLGGDFSAIQELFGRVAGKLQHPRFRLQTADGRPVVLQIAGGGSKHAGTVSVTTGEPYGTPGSFYGRISQDGTTTVRDEAVVTLLREFAADPAGTAAAFGKLTGQCCFCKIRLTDARSLAVGYGQKCAANLGLPWGEQPVQGELPLEAAPRPEKSLPPWDAPEAVSVPESLTETKEEALAAPFTLGRLIEGCPAHFQSYEALPLFV